MFSINSFPCELRYKCFDVNQLEFLLLCVCVRSPVFFFLHYVCVRSGRRLERVEQVVGVRFRLLDVEDQGVHPALTWHRGQRVPGARPPVSQLHQRAVPTE